jgi:methyl-accepting chemotaxis protein
MKSIKTKLILSFSILILGVTLIIGIISLESGYRSLKVEAQKSIKSLAAEGAKITESRIETLVTTLEMIAKRKEIREMKWEVDLRILKEELEKTDFLDIGYVLPNGYTHYTDGTVRLMSDRAYIQEALKGNAKVSDVVISRVTRKPEIEVCVPILQEGEVVGAVVGKKAADALGNITKDGGYGRRGYAYMLNGKGTVIAHPQTDKVVNRYNPIEEVQDNPVEKSIAEAFQKMLETKVGMVSYQQNEIRLYAGFAPIQGTDWIFVITADEQEVLEAIPKMVRNLILVMIIVFLLSIGFVFLLDNNLTRPLIEMTKHSKRIAILDVSENIADIYLQQKDEIGTLSGIFQVLTIKLREIIMQITESANQVTATAQELTATSQQSAQTSQEVSRTVTEIARGAAEQANSTEAGSVHARKLGDMIERNNEHMHNLNETSNKVIDLVNSGLKDIDRLSNMTKENNEATKEICDIILQTKKSTEQISEASKVISEMAKQTNLVALNASIEAARAGEAGRGFAVVAEEIQRMADQSAESTKYIDQIIKELMGNVKEAVESMKRISTTSLEQQKSVTDTIHKYNAIAKSMRISEEAVLEMNQSQKDMNMVKSEILTMLQSLSTIAQQNAAGTQQAASSMEAQTESARELANASDRLSILAGNLQAITSQFQV